MLGEEEAGEGRLGEGRHGTRTGGRGEKKNDSYAAKKRSDMNRVGPWI